MTYGFGSNPTLYTLAEGEDATTIRAGQKIKARRYEGPVGEAPSFPWWSEYLRQEWERHHRLNGQTPAVPLTVQADRAYAARLRQWDLIDRLDGSHGERHVIWGEAMPTD